MIGSRHHDHRPRRHQVRPGRDRAQRRRQRPAARRRRRSTSTSVATINSTGNALPAPVVLDKAASEAQTVDRLYYRSLQGMRVRLPEAIATGGGTTKFRDVFVEPGTTAQRLFRKNDAAAETTPWSDTPAEIGIAPDGGAGNPADPRLPWRSTTQVDLDLFDVVRDVVGPLSYGFSFYKVMPQLTRRARADDPARPDQRHRAADGPGPAREHACGSRASTSRTTSRSARRTTATSSPRPSTTSAPTRSCARSRTGSRRPTSSPCRRSPCSPTAPTRSPASRPRSATTRATSPPTTTAAASRPASWSRTARRPPTAG